MTRCAVHMPVHPATQLGPRIAAHAGTGQAMQRTVPIDPQFTIVPGQINAAPGSGHAAPAVAGPGITDTGKRQQAVGHRAAREVHGHGQVVGEGCAVSRACRHIGLAEAQRRAADVCPEASAFIAYAQADAAVALRARTAFGHGQGRDRATTKAADGAVGRARRTCAGARGRYAQQQVTVTHAHLELHGRFDLGKLAHARLALPCARNCAHGERRNLALLHFPQLVAGRAGPRGVGHVAQPRRGPGRRCCRSRHCALRRQGLGAARIPTTVGLCRRVVARRSRGQSAHRLHGLCRRHVHRCHGRRRRRGTHRPWGRRRQCRRVAPRGAGRSRRVSRRHRAGRLGVVTGGRHGSGLRIGLRCRAKAACTGRVGNVEACRCVVAARYWLGRVLLGGVAHRRPCDGCGTRH